MKSLRERTQQTTPGRMVYRGARRPGRRELGRRLPTSLNLHNRELEPVVLWEAGSGGPKGEPKKELLQRYSQKEAGKAFLRVRREGYQRRGSLPPSKMETCEIGYKLAEPTLRK